VVSPNAPLVIDPPRVLTEDAGESEKLADRVIDFARVGAASTFAESKEPRMIGSAPLTGTSTEVSAVSNPDTLTAGFGAGVKMTGAAARGISGSIALATSIAGAGTIAGVSKRTCSGRGARNTRLFGRAKGFKAAGAM